MRVSITTRMLRICDRSCSKSGESEFRKCFSLFFWLGIFVASFCVFVSRVGRQMNWAHATGTVVDTVETKMQTRNGHYILYQPVISFQPEDNEHAANVTFVSSYGTGNGQNTKYPIGSTMTVLYDSRHYERAEMVNQNKKGIRVSGIWFGILALVSGVILCCVYQQATDEAALEQRLYPPGYEIHDDNYDPKNPAGGNNPSDNTPSGAVV